MPQCLAGSEPQVSNAPLIKAAAGAARLAGSGVAMMAAFLRWSIIAAVAVMLVCITTQVVMRYVFGRTPSWTEELAILMFAWATLGGFALGIREGFHVRMTLLLDWLPTRALPLSERVIHAIAAALGAYLFWSGWRYVDVTRGARSAAIEYPIELLHGLAPVAGALIFVFALEHFFRRPVTADGAEIGIVVP